MNSKRGDCPVVMLVLLVIVALVAAGGLHAYNVMFPHVYSTFAEISLTPNHDEIAGVVTGSTGNDAAHFGNEIATMKSADFLTPIIQQNRYDATWARRSGKGAQLSAADAVDYLHKVLVIEQEPGSSTIKITAKSVDPKEAADIANNVANAYVELRKTQAVNSHDAQVTVLQKQVDDQGNLVTKERLAARLLPQDAATQQKLKSDEAVLDAEQTNLTMLKSGMASPLLLPKVVTYAGVPTGWFFWRF